jgi:hypothetical protein
MRIQKLLVWPLFAALMGFALGGSFVFGLYGPQATAQYISNAAKHQPADHDAKSKKEETDESLAYYTLWLMVFTGILAVATVGLGGATLGLYLTGEKQIEVGRTTAKAAELSARAAIGSELPILNVESISLTAFGDGIPPLPGLPPKRFQVFVTFKNVGRTAAFPTAFCVQGLACQNLPNAPNYTAIMDLTPGKIIRQDGSYFIEGGHITISDAKITAIQAGEIKLWVFGFVSFLDFLDMSRDYRFCFSWGTDEVSGEVGLRRDRFTPVQYTRKPDNWST